MVSGRRDAGSPSRLELCACAGRATPDDATAAASAEQHNHAGLRKRLMPNSSLRIVLGTGRGPTYALRVRATPDFRSLGDFGSLKGSLDAAFRPVVGGRDSADGG